MEVLDFFLAQKQQILLAITQNVIITESLSFVSRQKMHSRPLAAAASKFIQFSQTDWLLEDNEISKLSVAAC